MIMEFVEGETLANRAARAPLSTADAVSYADQVLSALSYAHKQNIIHRDIKPANMMLTPQGVVKLMDFGIARSATDGSLTTTGTTLGSLNYMPPEQVRGESADARSDIYSFGVSLYEMLTGKLPFQGDSQYSLMTAHLNQTPAGADHPSRRPACGTERNHHDGDREGSGEPVSIRGRVSRGIEQRGSEPFAIANTTVTPHRNHRARPTLVDTPHMPRIPTTPAPPRRLPAPAGTATPAPPTVPLTSPVAPTSSGSSATCGCAAKLQPRRMAGDWSRAGNRRADYGGDVYPAALWNACGPEQGYVPA